MISLQTLSKATAQEVFDQVASHLLTQKIRSQDEELNCQYRGDNGTSCAAGCLMLDSEYDPMWEQVPWRTLALNCYVPDTHMYLISELQNVHDKARLDEWKFRLELVAKNYALATTVLDKYND